MAIMAARDYYTIHKAIPNNKVYRSVIHLYPFGQFKLSTMQNKTQVLQAKIFILICFFTY